MGSVDYKYFAFISYNHRDQRYAKQVHSLLERIRIPSDAVGGLPDGLKDKKGVRPVFRDQDELSSSSSLPDSLQQNLQASAYLIVLCSPEAAHSRWVNEEIRYFIELGREKNILCLILRGGATFYSDASPSGAFPPALRREDNSLPLAADIRAGKTTLSREVMRLAAGILKVGFDVVYQRERRRRRNQLALAVGLFAVILGPLFYKIFNNQIVVDAANRDAEVSKSIVIAQQSDIAAREIRYSDAAAIALEGMPDARRGISRPLVPKVQAALSRNFWKIPDLHPISSGEGAIVAVPTALGVRALIFGDDGNEILDGEGHTIGTVDAKAASGLLADFSADGRYLAMGSSDGQVTIADMTGKTVSSFKASSDVIYSLRISRDGQRVLTTQKDGRVDVWKGDGSRVLSLQLNGDGASSATFSRNGDVLVTASGEHATVWGFDGKVIFDTRFNGQRVTGVDLSPDGNTLAASLSDKSIEVRYVSTGLAEWQLRYGDAFADKVEFSPDGNHLLIHTVDGITSIWLIEGERLLANIRHDPDGLYGARFVNDRQVIFNKDVAVWNFGMHGIKEVKVGPSNEDYDLSPDGRRLATADGYAGAVSLFDSAGNFVTALTGHNDQVWSVRFNPRTPQLLTTSSDKSAILWTEGKPLVQLSGHDGIVWEGRYNSDGSLLATSSSDGTSRLWDANGTPLATLKGPDFPIGVSIEKLDESPIIAGYNAAANWHKAVFSPDGKTIATISGDSAARLWTSRGSFIRTLNTPVRPWAIAFSPDGKLIAVGLEGGEIQLFDIEGKLLRSLKNESGVNRLKFADGGSKLLVTTQTSAVLFDANGKEIISISVENHGNFDADVNDDGSLIATANGKALQTWDEEGNLLQELDDTFAHVRFLSSHLGLLAGTATAVLIVPDVPLGQKLVDESRKRLNHCLSADERKTALLPPLAPDQQPENYCKG